MPQLAHTVVLILYVGFFVERRASIVIIVDALLLLRLVLLELQLFILERVLATRRQYLLLIGK